MRRILLPLLLIATLGLLVTSCSQRGEDISPVAPGDDLNSPLFGYVLPDGAVLESTTLKIYLTYPNMEDVTAHLITADWDELTATWNDFAAAYEATGFGGFAADTEGYLSMDLTAQFIAWAAGDIDNFGLLLKQPEFASSRSKYFSRDAAANCPLLEVVFTLDGETLMEVVEPMADTYIWENYPTSNFGGLDYLYTGFYHNVADDTYLEKQTLIRFDIDILPPEVPQEGCTLTIGYWKTHAGFGPQADDVTPLLPIWLGEADGDKSLYVEDAGMAYDILRQKTYGTPSNGITKLYAQLLGSKLNVENGADDADVAEGLSGADAFLATHDWNDWGDLSNEDKGYVLDLKDLFDNYNNGDIGPGHCD